MAIPLRRATPGDVEGIALLHADSWRRNYRGAYRDSYLDGDVLSDRIAVWGERLSAPPAGFATIVAVDGGGVVGLAHTIFDEDPEWGALLDNLHVAHGLRGTGVGRRLMAETAAAVLAARPRNGLYLWVLEQNRVAQGFYAARGGEHVDGRLAGPFPGGGRAYALRYVWRDPATLL